MSDNATPCHRQKIMIHKIPDDWDNVKDPIRPSTPEELAVAHQEYLDFMEKQRNGE